MEKKFEIESAVDALLDMSMTGQGRMMDITVYLKHSESVDAKDDERRKRSFKYDKWNEDMMKAFNKALKQAIAVKDWELVEETQKKMEIFQKDYFHNRKKLQDEELYLEELDDNNRIRLLAYTASCIEKIQDESCAIDLYIINENIKKKRKNID